MTGRHSHDRYRACDRCGDVRRAPSKVPTDRPYWCRSCIREEGEPEPFEVKEPEPTPEAIRYREELEKFKKRQRERGINWGLD